MLRNLIIIAVIFLIFFLLKNRLGLGKKPRVSRPAERDDSKAGESMVQCLSCQTYVPASEAISKDSHSFCCQQHLRDWQKTSSQNKDD